MLQVLTTQRMEKYLERGEQKETATSLWFHHPMLSFACNIIWWWISCKYWARPKWKKKKKSKSTLEQTLDPPLKTSWDYEGLSHRQAASTYITTAKSLGIIDDNIVVSKSSVQHTWSKNRADLGLLLEETAVSNPPPLVLHWDGKLLPQTSYKQHLEEKISIIATGIDTEEMLRVSIAENGTGPKTGAVVLKRWNDWALQTTPLGFLLTWQHPTVAANLAPDSYWDSPW